MLMMDEAAQRSVEVAVALPVEGTFSYLVPSELVGPAKVGCRVLVPFNKRTVEGYIVGPGERQKGLEMKELVCVQDEQPFFPESMVPFFKWVSNYYIFPLGRVIQSVLPPGLNRKVMRDVVVTGKGLEYLSQGKITKKEQDTLNTILNPSQDRATLPLPVLKNLEAQGLISIKEKIRGRVGPLIRSFVDFEAEGRGKLCNMDLNELRARDEGEFLRVLSEDGPIMLSELRKRYANADYLVNKWSKKGLIYAYKAPVYRDPQGLLFKVSEAPLRLSSHQQRAINKIVKMLEKGKFATCLIYGITGSGKTEVYIQAIERVIQSGKQAIVLVPEIALASYMEAIFRARLKATIAVYHSGLSQGERYDQWMKMARGEVDVVIGARSALFSPLARLGLIVVDEEHDKAYKQDRAPYYQGRDAAVARGKLENAVVLLGSGTPSVQSYANCCKGRYELVTMPERVEKRQFPRVELVDMKEVDADGARRILSPRLLEALEDNLRQGKQSILFLNRRGFFRLFVCGLCGSVVTCPNCNVSLIYHLEHNKLVCHYCGFWTPPQESCPTCKRNGLKSWGFGTERLEHELRDLFPNAQIARMDTDSARRKGKAQIILRDFINHQIDILLGTQMITKGFDVPDVTLVGVVGAELSLAFPDFRAAERTFQLLSQVAGRAGRGGERGMVIIQTYNPDHYAIQAAVSQNYEELYKKEIELRRQLGFPPFTYLVSLKLQGNSSQQTEDAARALAERLRSTVAKWPKKGKEIQILGPAEAPIAKLKGKYRWHILIKASKPFLAQRLLEVAKKRSEQGLKTKGVQIILDVDPYQMM